MKYKEIIIKILNKMNENPELFKKNDLENTITLLSNPDFYIIKSEVSQSLNFFKHKTKSHKTSKAMGFDNLKNSNNYHISIDSENNLIVLKDKFNENRFIIIAQYVPGSLNLYKSLISNMNPGIILIDKEPYQYSEINKNSSEIGNSNMISVDVKKFQTFNSQAEFKEFLLNYQKSNKDSYDKSNTKVSQFSNVENLSELEEMILYCLGLKGKKIFFYDVPLHNYTKSFTNQINKFEDNNYLPQFNSYINILNLFETVNWLSLQEFHGCKNCASFFDRNLVNWWPLKPEFLIDKNFLPNSKFLNSYRIKKVYEYANTGNKTENILVFAENARNLCVDYLNFDPDKNSLKEEFDDYFEKEDFSESKANSRAASLALILKENFKEFHKNLPIKLKNVNCQSVNLLKNDMENHFKMLYGIGDSEGRELKELYEEINFKNSSENTGIIGENKRNRFTKMKKGSSCDGDNSLECEPKKFVKTELIDFMKYF
jgi:hypothetical protein